MSRSLDGEHYCVKHQGNHSHYATENCTVCTLRAKLAASEYDCENVSDELTQAGNRESALRAENERLREALLSLRSDMREPAEREGGLMRHFYDRICAALEPKGSEG